MEPNVVRYILAYAGYALAVNVVPGPWQSWRREGGSVDGWTATHLFWGALSRRYGINLKVLMLLGVLNEVAEAAIRETRPELLWGAPEDPRNVAVDIMANAAGWLAADAVARRPIGGP
jgi:hypothetical protein